MQRFRKKPVVITALQWSGAIEGLPALAEWAAQADLEARKRIGHMPSARDVVLPIDFVAPDKLEIRTMEGVMVASPHDWIICGVQGEFYPCKPHVFEATYEEVIG